MTENKTVNERWDELDRQIKNLGEQLSQSENKLAQTQVYAALCASTLKGVLHILKETGQDPLSPGLRRVFQHIADLDEYPNRTNWQKRTERQGGAVYDASFGNDSGNVSDTSG